MFATASGARAQRVPWMRKEWDGCWTKLKMADRAMPDGIKMGGTESATTEAVPF